MKGSSVKDLTEKLTRLMEAVEQRNLYKAKLSNLSPDLLKPGILAHFLTFLTFIALVIVGCSIGSILPRPIYFIITAVVAIGSIFLSVKLRSLTIDRINQSRIKEYTQKHKEEIETHQNDYDIWNDTILEYRKESFVPDAHLSSFAIHHMIMYLINGRADNLQEAINMYENNYVNKAHSRILAGKHSNAGPTAPLIGNDKTNQAV